jgi:hypothetical protein
LSKEKNYEDFEISKRELPKNFAQENKSNVLESNEKYLSLFNEQKNRVFDEILISS